MKEEYTIAHQYSLFLERMQLDERYMHPEQLIQIKQAFYGAWGMLLVLLRDDISNMADGHRILSEMLQHISDFWEDQI